MFGYASNEIAFVHCTDDFVSPSIGLHACIPTRVWNSLWRRAAVQWNYYFIRLLEFYGRFSSTPSKADCFTYFGTTLFQTKSEHSQIWHKWVSLFPFYLSATFYLLVMAEFYVHHYYQTSIIHWTAMCSSMEYCYSDIPVIKLKLVFPYCCYMLHILMLVISNFIHRFYRIFFFFNKHCKWFGVTEEIYYSK